MSYNKNVPQFFLGANSPSGFFSYFNQLYYPKDGWFCYILKGGPGTGKSSLMKQIARSASEKGIEPELLYCSSDPASLDAVILNELKISIVDGTAPHCMDPIYPGISDKIIDLGKYWDENKLRANKTEILKNLNRNSLFHKRAKGYLNAYRGIKISQEAILSVAVNTEKINEFSKRLTKRLFKRISLKKGKETIRFISAITPAGMIFFESTVALMSNEIYVIDDKYSAVGSLILKLIKENAVNLGHDVISCYSPLAPESELECIIFPQNKLALAVSTPNYPLNKLKSLGKKINATRFLDKENISNNLKLLNSDRKIECELLNAAVKNLSRAKEIHDNIERFYVPAMNFTEVDKLSSKLAKEILG